MRAKQRPEFPGEMNPVRLVEEFSTDAKCRAVLEALRWPGDPECPRCRSKNILRIPGDRAVLDCRHCGYQFTVTAGTIFHDTHLPLRKWFMATYLLCESKKGMSSNQLKRTLNVSYKTAWYLTHRIRAAVAEAFTEPLTGVVEVEAFVGSTAKNMHKADRDRMINGRGDTGNKTMVLGAIQRGGQVHFRIEQRRTSEVLHGFIGEHVANEAEAIMTDEHTGYHGVGDENTRHATVNHGTDDWDRADVHTNTVDGVWSLFKQSIVGSYHQLSAKHLNAYLDEMAFRFNNRENPYLFRDTLLRLLASKSLPYKYLIE